MINESRENIELKKDISIFSSSRFLIIKLLFALCFIIIASQLIKIQIIESTKYKLLARKQYEKEFSLPATRGKIFDRNGNVLVSNTIFISFGADLKIANGREAKVSETFSRVFGKPKSFYLSKFKESENYQNQKKFIWLERRVKPETAKKIEAEKLECLVVINEPKRLYHYDELAGALLGFTNIDNKGISGIELQYDNQMKGVNGSIVMQRDGLGRVRPSADYPRKEPINGRDIFLTIDLKYQAIVDEELKNGVISNKADGGCAVVLNPKTGEVLSFSIYPSINPNEPSKIDISAARNRIISDLFEPGSVFKLISATAAFENGIIAPQMRFDAEGGKMKVPLGDGKFRLISDSHEYNWLTFEQAIEVSSNIVFAKASKFIGGEKLFRAARDFGFGIMTGIDLPGEIRGILKKPSDTDWSGTTLQTMSYGYEVGATPLQIVNAYSAFANNGYLMKPYVVSTIKEPNGKTFAEQKPQIIRKVFCEDTYNKLLPAFEGVIERGTAKEIKINGVRIAGKTGTSRKYMDGKYADNYYTASFVGFFPIDDPQIVCLIMLDNPKARGYYGGTTSGPIFRAIAERIIASSYKFSKTYIASESGNENITVPDVRMIQSTLAKRILENCGLNCQIFGTGAIVVKQSPEPGKKIEKGESVSLILNSESITSSDGTITVPDVRGMSVRRAINRLMLDDLDVKVQGSGNVVKQAPEAGSRIRLGSSVILFCNHDGLSQASLY